MASTIWFSEAVACNCLIIFTSSSTYFCMASSFDIVSQSHPCVPFCISYDVPKPGLWNLALCDRALSCLLVVCIELELEVMGGLEGTVLGKSSDHFDSCMKPVLGRHGCGLRLVE
uniref:Putative acyl-coa-binding domain-containing protein n=1 Tax=Ixodes ricinus TaxID=34613 RepID=A0A0K8RC32_IXORI